MKLKLLKLAAVSCALLPTLSSGQTVYTWTGDAADGDWTNAANWDANGVPVDTNPAEGRDSGLQLSSSDEVALGGTDLPTLNIPVIGGNYLNNGGDTRSTPFVNIKSGGAISLIIGGRDDTYWTNPEGLSRDILTVGDGISGENEDVDVTVSTSLGGSLLLMRHPGSMTHTFTVNADGMLTFPQAIEFSAGTPSDRFAAFIIAGGTVVVQGTVTDLIDNGNTVTFTLPDGSFTAAFGADFLTIEDVENSFGVDILSSPGVGLTAVDNLDGTFTVNATGAADPNYWTGTGGSTWDVATTSNFTTSLESDALVVDTFANAVAVSAQATFADSYFDAGVAQAVAFSNITIDAGGVETGLVDFLNSATPYTVASSDSEGIKGTTQLRVSGGGSVTLLGAHAYSGATTVGAGSTLMLGDGSTDGAIANSASIANDGSLVFNATNGPAVLSGDIGGTGSLEKKGADSLTLNGAPNFTGATIVSGGTLTFEDLPRSATYEIAAGAVLDFSIDTGNNILGGAPTLTGGGTIRHSGTASPRWPVTVATFLLDSGALIDVQAGTFNGGNSTPEIWIGNLSDLNVAAGAEFAGSTSLIEVNELTGLGLISSTLGGSITFGVDNGSATFDGVLAGIGGSYRKVGSGTQTLTGINSYTGDTTVEEGTLTLTSTGRLTFAPTLNGVTNQITGPAALGTGNIDLQGEIYFDFVGTELVSGNAWQLVDDSNLMSLTYNTTFSVNSSVGAFSEVSEGEWKLADGDQTWTFLESNGVLSLKILLGSPDFNEWASGFLPDDVSDPAGDFDNDGQTNDDEYLFGLDPTDSSSFNPIIVPLDVDAGTLTFTRRDPALTGVLTSVETSTDLEEWTRDTDANLTPSVAVNDIETVMVGLSPDLLSEPTLFVRINQGDIILYSADFEDGDGGFAATVDAPNDWAYGAPDSDNEEGLIITTGSGGSANCWGTNLGDFGDGSGDRGTVTPSSDSVLRGPDAAGVGIDLTGVTAADLSFAAALDVVAGNPSDIIEVLVKQVGTDATLVTLSAEDLGMTPSMTADWSDYGPFDISAAAGNSVYLEFRYSGQSGDSAYYLGLYIDDITVREKP